MGIAENGFNLKTLLTDIADKQRLLLRKTDPSEMIDPQMFRDNIYDLNLKSINVKNGKTIFGVLGSYTETTAIDSINLNIQNDVPASCEITYLDAESNVITTKSINSYQTVPIKVPAVPYICIIASPGRSKDPHWAIENSEKFESIQGTSSSYPYNTFWVWLKTIDIPDGTTLRMLGSSAPSISATISYPVNTGTAVLSLNRGTHGTANSVTIYGVRSDGTMKDLSQTTDTTYTITYGEANEYTKYIVYARGYSYISSSNYVTVDYTKITFPELDLQAIRNSDGSIKLQWTKIPGATGYKIKNQLGEVIAEVSSDTNTHTREVWHGLYTVTAYYNDTSLTQESKEIYTYVNVKVTLEGNTGDGAVIIDFYSTSEGSANTKTLLPGQSTAELFVAYGSALTVSTMDPSINEMLRVESNAGFSQNPEYAYSSHTFIFTIKTSDTTARTHEIKLKRASEGVG